MHVRRADIILLRVFCGRSQRGEFGTLYVVNASANTRTYKLTHTHTHSEYMRTA